MNQIFRLVVGVLTAILLSSCEVLVMAAMMVPSPDSMNGSGQQLISEKEIKSKELEAVKTIALLEIPDPPNYGKEADGRDTAEYGAFRFGNTSQAFLKQYLEQNGYKVIEYTPYQERKNPFRLIEDYNDLDIKGADAYLDVAPVEVKYTQKLSLNFNYVQRPYVSVAVRLVSAETNKVIYAASVRYGWEEVKLFPREGILIESPEDHRYESHEALKAKKEEAIERLVLGVDAVSFYIANKIGKRANQLYSENVSSISKSNLNEQPYLDSAVSGAVLSGTYVSDIKRGPPWMFSDRKPWFTFEQNGNDIIGTDVSKNGSKIYGIRNGDTIKFKYWGSFRLIVGRWKINPDGTSLEGTWEADNEHGSWNLTRIE